MAYALICVLYDLAAPAFVWQTSGAIGHSDAAVHDSRLYVLADRHAAVGVADGQRVLKRVPGDRFIRSCLVRLGCPQTVYMEFLFRPIDRLFQGNAGKGGKPARALSGWRWWARAAVYLVVCSFLTHTFLAYFVGTDRLGEWVTKSPLQHPIPFLVMAISTILLMFNFIYFREQTCLIACPYGRFQSVMLDRRSSL